MTAPENNPIIKMTKKEKWEQLTTEEKIEKIRKLMLTGFYLTWIIIIAIIAFFAYTIIVLI